MVFRSTSNHNDGDNTSSFSMRTSLKGLGINKVKKVVTTVPNINWKQKSHLSGQKILKNTSDYMLQDTQFQTTDRGVEKEFKVNRINLNDDGVTGGPSTVSVTGSQN